MRRRLRVASGVVLLIVAGVAIPLTLPLGHEPRNASEGTYIRNATESRHYINNNPIAGMLTLLFVVRTTVSDFHRVPGSCSGGTDASIPEYSDVVASVTDYGVFAIPLERYQTSCAGFLIVRGSLQPPPTNTAGGERVQPAPPAPPPPAPPPQAMKD